MSRVRIEGGKGRESVMPRLGAEEESGIHVEVNREPSDIGLGEVSFASEDLRTKCSIAQYPPQV